MSLWKNPLYNRWWCMVHRCHNPQSTAYPNYGGRGISVCDRWRDFAAFEEDILRDLGPCPAGLSIDRIDNDGGYEPGNVRWATRSQQALNQRRPKTRRRKRADIERIRDKQEAERVIGEVRAEMARQRIGQVKLGQGTGLSQNKLSRRLTGAIPFSTDDLARIADFLGVPIGQLADPPVRQAAS